VFQLDLDLSTFHDRGSFWGFGDAESLVNLLAAAKANNDTISVTADVTVVGDLTHGKAVVGSEPASAAMALVADWRSLSVSAASRWAAS
jgi:hypothetical protein